MPSRFIGAHGTEPAHRDPALTVQHEQPRIASALDQFLVYLVWRDTKAALLLFIRAAGISAIMGRALGTMRQHPKYKRPGKTSSEERHDFVSGANGDENREIRLAFPPFLIGSRKQ